MTANAASGTKCAGCAKRNRGSGPGEVVVAAPIHLHRLAVGADEADTLAAPDLPDAREWKTQHAGQIGDALARVRMRREAELVVVAARHHGRAPQVGPRMFLHDVA